MRVWTFFSALFCAHSCVVLRSGRLCSHPRHAHIHHIWVARPSRIFFTHVGYQPQRGHASLRSEETVSGIPLVVYAYRTSVTCLNNKKRVVLAYHSVPGAPRICLGWACSSEATSPAPSADSATIGTAGGTLFSHADFMSSCDLVLASQSPRRREIVGMMGLAVSRYDMTGSRLGSWRCHSSLMATFLFFYNDTIYLSLETKIHSKILTNTRWNYLQYLCTMTYPADELVFAVDRYPTVGLEMGILWCHITQ